MPPVCIARPWMMRKSAMSTSAVSIRGKYVSNYVNNKTLLTNLSFNTVCFRCNKYGEYPLGHPEIVTENFAPVEDYFGLVKCSVLPPRALYHPVLPYRTQGKLIFPLCRTCADTLQQTPCQHGDRERTLHGTWVTYQLLQIEEVWHFPQHTDRLFKGYIDTFLKIKQEVRF